MDTKPFSFEIYSDGFVLSNEETKQQISVKWEEFSAFDRALRRIGQVTEAESCELPAMPK